MPDFLQKLNAVKARHKEDFVLFSTASASGIKAYSTGSPAIDAITGIGGFAHGRISEIFGPESSGKSTLLLSTIASLLSKDATARVIYADFEYALDVKYAEHLGVPVYDQERFIVLQPNCLEDGFDAIDELVSTGEIDFVAVDSLAAAVPRKELEGDYGDQIVGLKAKAMAQALRKLTGLLSKHKTHMSFINHTIAKIGTLGFGSPEDTPGGKALKFYASQRIKLAPGAFVTKAGKVEGGSDDAVKDKVGRQVRFEIVKNKLAVPFKSTEVLIRFGEGFDNVLSTIKAAIDCGTIGKINASCYSFEGVTYRGLENFRDTVAGNSELFARIAASIRSFSVQTSEESTIDEEGSVDDIE